LILPTTDGLADCDGGFLLPEKARASPQETSVDSLVSLRSLLFQTQTPARPGEKNSRVQREREKRGKGESREERKDKEKDMRCSLKQKRDSEREEWQ
jgi:hypothetical protein